MTEATPQGFSAMEKRHFGSFLRDAREARGLTLDRLAKLTKVPEHSLKLIEAGKLEDLPPEVFVRGFVRSYARAIGIDDVEPVRLFDELVRERQSERVAALGTPIVRVASSRTTAERGVAVDRLPTTAEREWSIPGGSPVMPVGVDAHAPAADDDGMGSRRGYGLAVFVVIVLLIATITLSYLLRQPPPSGEGLSLAEPVGQVEGPGDAPALTAPSSTI